MTAGSAWEASGRYEGRMATTTFLSWLPFGAVPEVPAKQLAKALTGPNPPQLLDVRTKSEHRNGHLKGAVNAPISSLARVLPGLKLDKSRPVVAICLSAHRSIPAVRILKDAGFDAVQLAGGMQSWRAAKLPEVTS